MLTLTKEATDKDRPIKTQLTISSKSCEEKISGERVWRNEGFFKDTKPVLNLEKNCLFYINQSYISFVKNDDLAMYHHNFIIGQLIVVANQPAEIDQYVCKDNEVRLDTCMYDLQTGKFIGLRCEVAFIVLRGDERELFLSYGFDTEKSSVLYSSSKQKLPDAFISTSFKRHYSENMNERREKEDFSTLLYYLPFITDRKEDINQHRNKVNLSPVDCSISFIKSFSKNKEKFNPSLLNSTDQDLRRPQVEMLYGVFRQMAEYSNNNLKRNADFLLGKLNKKADNIPWVGASKQRFDSSLYKLTY